MITNITVVGAGIMGRGIAYTAAISGYNVTLQDISSNSLQAAERELQTMTQRSMERNFIGLLYTSPSPRD